MVATRNMVKEKYTKLLHDITVVVGKLKDIMRETDFENAMKITEKAREKIFLSERARLKTKFEILANGKTMINLNDQNLSHGKTIINVNSKNLAHVKSAILNLTNNTVKENVTDLLNLGPKFVPTPTTVPFMDIITSTESAAVHLDNATKHHESESLRNQVSNALSKFVNKKIPSNLTKNQRRALIALRNDDETLIYPFDKGSGFVLLGKEDASAKMSAQLGDAKKIDNDPTNSLLSKFQRSLSKLRKEGKFTDTEYREIYPSDAVPPRMYGMVKAHKPSKDFPMRTVVSTVGTVSHATSKMLVNLIQPTLNKNSTRIKNSSSFVQEAKSWNIDANEIQVSFDAVALYPSIPISKAIDAMMNILHDDAAAITSRTKLELVDIKLLIELCLSKCYFLYENSIFTIDDAGPIGLSLMVVMAEAYLQHLEKTALNIAEVEEMVPISFKRYVDDSHARFGNLEQAEGFVDILNAQDTKIQYTMEIEDSEKSLSFLDVKICNDGKMPSQMCILNRIVASTRRY